ncbi:hypothetical protein SFRURICE_001865 [Spodoptera frugiperda]|nr:hypothetical protein SFRURICE_001865 [Spodoptera frugiperda]
MKLIVLLALFALATAKHESYTGWKSYFVQLVDEIESKLFASLADKYELDILSHPIIGREGLLLVKPEYNDNFIQELISIGINFRIHSEDVKSELDYDDLMIEQQHTEMKARNIDDYLDSIGRQYPDVATVVNAADSFEGRPIKYLKISKTNFEDESKPVIFIDGGIHAREWIAPPTVTWAIHKLVEDLTESDLLDNFDWILLPVANPDGYKFTFNGNRFWRKTRSTDQNPLSTVCPGVDVNRNFDFYWNTVGTSNSACSDIFAGSRAFSEVETRVVRDILHEHLHRIALYITMHSFGSMILYPWGHDGSLSSNALGLHTVGVAMATTIDQLSLPHFAKYVVGNSALVLNYRASGGAEDYAHSIGVPLAYTMELPGFTSTMQGFNLNPRYIQQVCNETWEGIVVGARRAGDLFKNKRL